MREEIFSFIKEFYGVEPDYPFASSPDAAVLRHPSGKWFGIMMQVPKNKLGLLGEEPVDIINLKRDPMLGLADGERIFPAYHMNKEHWISVLLNGSVPFEELKALIAMSYDQIK